MSEEPFWTTERYRLLDRYLAWRRVETGEIVGPGEGTFVPVTRAVYAAQVNGKWVELFQ